jgi:RNA polymerase sigma-70 factor (ECF subfamily)
MSRPPPWAAIKGALSLSATLPLEELPASRGAAVLPLRDPQRLDDAGLLEALRAGDVLAPGAFFDRFAMHVERMLARIFGGESDLSDLVNETFYRALERLDQVHDPSGLKAWLTSIAVYVAREQLRATRRRRWVQLWDADAMPEPATRETGHEDAEAVRRLYQVLGGMPEDERIVFSLRFVEEMELSEVASACGVSLATIKRKLARAETLFAARARRDPVLREWLEGSARWSDR